MTQPDGRTDPSRSREINETIRYTMWSVFALDPAAGPLPEDRARLAAEAEQSVAGLAGKDLVVRGWYDVGGLRADADLMVWWHAPDVETVQQAYRELRRSALGRHLRPVWSVVGLHRPAEFNKAHVPAFLAGEAPARLRVRVPVRAVVRVVPAARRRASQAARRARPRGPPYPDVRANTVSAFALNDYEWILAFEADELHRIVDLMRDLRNVGARRHVRHEVPFFAGPRQPLAEIVAAL